jgi:hypothetical protein
MGTEGIVPSTACDEVLRAALGEMGKYAILLYT